MAHDVWTEERIEKLKELHAQGQSFGKIARALGHGISRNAAIGKARRLGLPTRLDGPRRSTVRVKPSKPKAPKPTPEPVAPPPTETACNFDESVALAAPDMPTSGIYDDPLARGIPHAVERLRKDQCRFPIGEAKDPDFHYCPEERCSPNSQYCAHHDRIVWNGIPPRTRAKVRGRA